jgi:hypothetical protein
LILPAEFGRAVAQFFDENVSQTSCELNTHGMNWEQVVDIIDAVCVECTKYGIDVRYIRANNRQIPSKWQDVYGTKFRYRGCDIYVDFNIEELLIVHRVKWSAKTL